VTYRQKRVTTWLLLLYVVGTASNYYLNLCFMPRYAGVIMMLGVLAVLILLPRVSSTREETERDKNAKGHSDDQ